MKLLTDKVFTTDNSIKLMDLLYNCFIRYEKENYSFKNLISYNEFKTIIHKFIIEIMGLFLVDTKYSDDTYDVYIKNLRKNIKGLFYSTNNCLIINESVILDIYNGDLESFIVIFHELNHFKIKYDVLDGVINEDICRIVKEKLLRDEDCDSMQDELFKNKNSCINDFYYDNNYRLFSEELVADINAKFDFVLLMRELLVAHKLYDDLSKEACSKLLDDLIGDDYLNYNNHIRDFSMSLNFNSIHLDFSEAFDVSVKYHPEWLKYPQISIEYYIDEDGNVKKKNIGQLKSSLDESIDDDTKKYICGLINKLEVEKGNNDQKISK